jgi:hypothetical protein
MRSLNSVCCSGAVELPDLSDDALMASTEKWLKPFASGVRQKSDLMKIDWEVGGSQPQGNQSIAYLPLKDLWLPLRSSLILCAAHTCFITPISCDIFHRLFYITLLEDGKRSSW